MLAVGDHDDVVHQDEPVTDRRTGDRPVGRFLDDAGSRRTEPVEPDKDASRRPARLGSLKDRASGEPSCLDPTDGDDGSADKSVTIVEVERQGHVVLPVTKKIVGDPSRRGGIVDPSRKGDACVGVRMRRTAGPALERPDETAERGCDGHDRDLRSEWIHGGPPPQPAWCGTPSGLRPVARLEGGAVISRGSTATGTKP